MTGHETSRGQENSQLTSTERSNNESERSARSQHVLNDSDAGHSRSGTPAIDTQHTQDSGSESGNSVYTDAISRTSEERRADDLRSSLYRGRTDSPPDLGRLNVHEHATGEAYPLTEIGRGRENPAEEGNSNLQNLLYAGNRHTSPARSSISNVSPYDRGSVEENHGEDSSRPHPAPLSVREGKRPAVPVEGESTGLRRGIDEQEDVSRRGNTNEGERGRNSLEIVEERPERGEAEAGDSAHERDLERAEREIPNARELQEAFFNAMSERLQEAYDRGEIPHDQKTLDTLKGRLQQRLNDVMTEEPGMWNNVRTKVRNGLMSTPGFIGTSLGIATTNTAYPSILAGKFETPSFVANVVSTLGANRLLRQFGEPYGPILQTAVGQGLNIAVTYAWNAAAEAIEKRHSGMGGAHNATNTTHM